MTSPDECPSMAAVAELLEAQSQQAATLVDHTSTADTLWVLLCGFLVFFMQTGFAMLEAGAVRSKNVQNILIKNVLDVCFACVAFWIFGFAFAYGDISPDDGGSPNGFIGTSQFALSGGFDDYVTFFFQLVFAAVASTIVSGAIAERTQFRAYLIYSFVITGFIYPVVVHWTWSSYGWLSPFHADGPTLGETGMMDFAGSAIVHSVGGWSALVAAILVGPRTGRFVDGEAVTLRGHSAALYFLGTLILWFGWFGFNPGSTLAAAGGGIDLASKVAVNTILAAAFGGITALVLYRITPPRVWDLIGVCNGVLAGLVSITAPCAVVEPWAAVLIGIIGTLIMFGFSKLLLKLKIDDVLDASGVHGAAGLWGVVSVGIFASGENVMAAYGFKDLNDYGFLYGGNFRSFGVQLFGGLIIMVWSVVMSFIVFFPLRLLGWLRVSEEEELMGLDAVKHGGHAFPEMQDMQNRMENLSKKKAGRKDRAMKELERLNKQNKELESRLEQIDPTYVSPRLQKK